MPINPPADSPGYRTRAQLRSAIVTLLGWAAVAANPPPGVAEFVNEQLRLAHWLLWQRFPAIRLKRWFSWSLVASERFYALDANDEQGLGTPPAPQVNANATGGTLADGTYSYRVARVDADGNTTLPSPAATASPSGFNTGACEVYLLAPAPGQIAWAIYGRSGGSEEWLAEVAVADVDPLAPYWLDDGTATPDGAVEATDGTIQSTALLNPYGLHEAWVETDTSRERLRQGLPRGELARDTSGRPSHFALHSALEVWPAPAATEGVLRVWGQAAATAFTSDADTPGVPDDLVQLLALAACKRHYRHADANDYIQMQEVAISNLVAGSHGAQRYLPGTSCEGPGWVEPIPSVPFT